MSRKIPEKRGQKKAKKPLTFGQKCVIGGPNENDSHLDRGFPDIIQTQSEQLSWELAQYQGGLLRC